MSVSVKFDLVFAHRRVAQDASRDAQFGVVFERHRLFTSKVQILSQTRVHQTSFRFVFGLTHEKIVDCQAEFRIVHHSARL